VGIAGTGGSDVDAQGAETGLGPEQGDGGLDQLEIVVTAGEDGGDRGKDDFLAVGVDRIALFDLELAAGEPADEIAEHAGDVVEQCALGVGLARPRIGIDLFRHGQRRVHPCPVVGVA